MIITKESRLDEVMKTAAGHDIIARLIYSLGLDEKVLKGPIGRLKIKNLKSISLGKLDDGFIDALLTLLNSLNEEAVDDETEVQPAWWKEAVFYEIYPRSFKDSNGDGIGDIRGIIEKLDYLKDLGVTALWIAPFYDSPNADNGYDIRDYKKIMAEFGTMEDVEELFDEAHQRGLKIIIDLVMNHTSDEHEFFQKSLAGDPKYKDYYYWRKQEEIPNNWGSLFSGEAWNYYPENESWVLHLFAKKQIDLNWDNPDVRKEMYDIANFWLDKGADGFRLDVVSFISKTEGLPDGNETLGKLESFVGVEHYFHGPHLDEYLQEFNKECLQKHDAYTVGECPGNGLEMSRLITGDDRGELSQLFVFDHLDNPGKARYDIYNFDLYKMAKEIIRWQTEYSNHCWPTVFFNNHDNPRMIWKIEKEARLQKILAKMLAAFQLTLRGTPYLYQGEEIGMTWYPFETLDDYRDVEAFGKYNELKEKGLSEEKIMARLSAGSRDHARTPVCWSAEEYAGFSTHEPWIGVNPDYQQINVAIESRQKDSVLNTYKKLIAYRKEHSALVYGDFEVVVFTKRVLVYRRKYKGEEYMVYLNLTHKQVDWPMEPTGDLIYCNYPWQQQWLQPYEANIYKVK